ncbi:aminomethyl-transferring glycine dehydrogenase subunit GcvPA [Paenibacillus radicis (ex Xue et al. 2023)]|uniref:Probable glycine dehydrogenase (decarboxylating) subunit 1 n=1 Tax=Paenibacillus radicis (ex Xue et al. 2023) TaxID=2972489 RepID=A0ABT1YUW9_9BACL|nr:aminomethyl-transferring glycine dehydrogenase subunit GcvPA [Paenibacillus radicis (ex Xue et al. 2023)]MCR8636735.1 aminomethyl-transferring glycine dehydrogenase subunit GcvPA [Paenibacillus radicis (ex Xue et al. 2023)]
MKHRYIPMTEQDQTDMLQTIGIDSVEDLFVDIPTKVRFQGRLEVSEALDEHALLKHMNQLAGKNADFERYTSFLGAGIYDHHLPVVINHVISRSEFYTAYTPYQPEISQGELQAIFEFQSYICELTGMAVANASMYDGATALAEAGALAHGATKRKQLLVSRAIHPEARQVVAATAKGLGLEIVEVGTKDGVTDLEELTSLVSVETAGVLVQSPNFFGCIEDLRAVEPLAHAAGALFIVSANPLSLGLLEAPGKLGADIVVGDAQPFGIPASLGGPTCGFFAVSTAWMRRMPGRIVGQTVDRDGKRGFVLTLQAREQHIRREKATSNICSNQALLALCASVYISTMGKQGIQDVADLNVQKAHYAADVLSRIPGVSIPYTQTPFFNEFVIKLSDAGAAGIKQINSKLLEAGFIGGYDLGNDDPALEGHMLVAVTERRTKAEIDGFARQLEAAI